MNVGIVGTGFGQRVVAPAFAGIDGCRVVDVASPRDRDAALALASRADVDLVSIHSPPFLHAEHVRAALAAGKAVLCDKPFTPDVATSEALAGEAVTAGVVHLVNFEFRYHPVRRLLRDLVHGGALGDVQHVTWVHVSSGSRVPLRAYGWLFDARRGGGWIGAWASHAVDTVRFCLGEVVAARGWPRTDVTTRPDADGALRECSAEDSLVASLTLENGATVAIDSTFAAAVSVPPRLTVVGTEGAVDIVGDARATLHRPGGLTEPLEVPRVAMGGDRHGAPMRAWAAAVCDIVTSGEVPDDAPTFADGYACDVVLSALR